MSTAPIDYGKAFGFKSVPAAAIFAVLYAPLAALFIFQAIKHRRYVFFIACMFCQIRVAAFVIRAVMCASDSAGQNLSLFTADEVLFGVGFFGLLYSAYTLCLDRLEASDPTPPRGLSRLTRNRMLFRLALMAGVVIGIIATTDALSSDASSRSTGVTLRKVSTIIFFVLTVLKAIQTVVLVRSESANLSYEKAGTSIGQTHGHFFLLLIAGFLLIREIFLIATLGDTSKQNREELWYPLIALPEILCMICLALPGMVPPKTSLPK
ncbi:hypothetical protein C8J56DRAFT_77056 [Mycena floridula]|nr:hypothetical protein C8J56DRAFT_77056 [Mycena floridula]